MRVVKTWLPRRVQGCVDHRRRIIWLDRGLDDAHQRSTLAYEVGRLQRGPTPDDPVLALAYRRDAADWAATMLIPIADLCFAYASVSCLPARELYREMARLLGVDEATVRARVRGLSDAEQDAVTDAVRNLPVVV